MSMSLDEKLTVYETVISALRKQVDMTEIMEQLPLVYQVEAIKFMEYLDQNEDLVNGYDTHHRMH